MSETWFTDFPDELARCLVDARNCAETCEAYLGSVDGADRHDVRRLVDVLAAPAAVSRVLIELIDQPPQLVLAAVRLCRDLTAQALDELGQEPPADVVESLRTVAVSTRALLDAAE